jgi:sugar O-acyltransferase (sialic acid O-acetyltransferase NeuD family)
MNGKRIAIYGAGAFGREVAWLIQACNQISDSYKTDCFIDDNPDIFDKKINEIPVRSFKSVCESNASIHLVNAIANSHARQTVTQKAIDKGFSFETLIYPNVERSTWVEIGQGSIICAGSIITTNIVLGEQVHINVDCTICHDSILGDFTTLAPGVHVSGWVHIGKRVFIGTGATIVNGTEDNPLIIGDDVVIGAGACVTNSLPSRTKVAGVPARSI